jgi:hypothetical protein
MKILVTEQQLTHIVNESLFTPSNQLKQFKSFKLKEDISADELIDRLRKQAAIKIPVEIDSVVGLDTLESEDIKRNIKKILNLCEKFEHNRATFFVYQQISSLSPENVIYDDNRREIAIYVGGEPGKYDRESRSIYYNDEIFKKIFSKYKNNNNIDLAIKYNILNVLGEYNIIDLKKFTSSVKEYNTFNTLKRYLNSMIIPKETNEIMQEAKLKDLKDLDLTFINSDKYSDEGLSMLDRFGNRISRAFQGLNEKEYYYTSQLKNIFDELYSDDEGDPNVFYTIDDNDNDFIAVNLNFCHFFLRTMPGVFDKSVIDFLDNNTREKKWAILEKAVKMSSNTKFKKVWANRCSKRQRRNLHIVE